MKKAYCAFNISRQAFISIGVAVADTPLTRLRGLLGKVRLRSDESLWVVPSRGIHTLGLMFPIDVIYLDSSMRVIELIEDMRPFHFGPLRMQCSSVLQLPLRSIYGSGTQLGDELLVCPPERLDAYWAEVRRDQCKDQGAESVAPPLVHSYKRVVQPIRSMLASRSDRRRSWRIDAPTLSAYYWTGGLPSPKPVRDIGPGGAFILAGETFYPDTLLQMVFEEPETMRCDRAHIRVATLVRRRTADGFAVSFIFASSKERQSVLAFLAQLRDRARFLSDQRLAIRDTGPEIPGGPADGEAVPRDRGEDVRSLSPDPPRGMLGDTGGQSLVEFALLLPLLLLLIVNVVNFGGMLYAWISVSNAARTGAQYLITGPAAAGSPVSPSASAVQTLVLDDLHALPNSSSAQVCVSSSSSTTVSCNSGSAPSSAPPPAETAEGSPSITYVVGAVDVTYTYTPLIPLWHFPALRIHATLPPTAIHRQAVMRILQ